LTAPDGHIRYSRSSDQSPVWVTGEALMALARKPLPLAAVALPGAHHDASSPATVHPRPTHHAHRTAATVRHRPAATPQHLPVSHGSLALAGDVGVLAALALAPVGVG
jgi:hypothetical protein